MTTYTLQHQLLELVQGDDYKLADSRAIVLAARGVTWPAVLTSVKIVIYEAQAACAAGVAAVAPSAVVDVDGIFTAGTASVPATASFDLPRLQTLKLSVGVRRYLFEVRGLLPSGSVTSLARGLVSVLASGF